MPADITPMRISVLLWSWRQRDGWWVKSCRCQHSHRKWLTALCRCFILTSDHMHKGAYTFVTADSSENKHFEALQDFKWHAVIQSYSQRSKVKHIYSNRHPTGWAIILQRWQWTRGEQNLTYPCIVQLYPVELQRACCVEIIKLRLGRRQTAARGGDGSSGVRREWEREGEGQTGDVLKWRMRAELPQFCFGFFTNKGNIWMNEQCAAAETTEGVTKYIYIFISSTSKNNWDLNGVKCID